jgi:hypothetical protein
MSIEKMREEFEAAFAEEMVARCGEGYRSSVEFFFVEKEPDGTYSNPIAHAGWWAWQASRAALVIELPPTPPVPEGPEEAIDDSHMDAYHSAVGMRHACLKFIEAAGVKVKP